MGIHPDLGLTLLTRFNPNASQMNKIVDFEVEPGGAGDT